MFAKRRKGVGVELSRSQRMQRGAKGMGSTCVMSAPKPPKGGMCFVVYVM